MVCVIAAILFWGGKAYAQETSSNVSFTESGDDNSTLTITVTGTAVDADVLNFENQLSGKSYSKVIFDGGGTVNDAFVRKLDNMTSIEVLDMSGVVVESLTSNTIPLINTGSNSTLKVMIFPKTEEVNGKMLLPSSLLDNYKWTRGLALTIIIPEGYTDIENAAFQNINGIKSVSLPSTLNYIGKYAFASTGLTKLSLPTNLDKIDDGAFYELKNLAVVKLNDNLRFIGAGAFGCSGDLTDNSQRTLVVPESVRYIGPYAFSERKYSDIYFEGKNTPVCPFGAFTYVDGYGNIETKKGTAFSGTDDKVHYCNGGFDANAKMSDLADKVSQGYANRENYINGGFYMTIMHYPTDAKDPDKYSDQSRKYETKFDKEGDSEKFDDRAFVKVGEEPEQLYYDYHDNSGSNSGASNYCFQFVNPGFRDTYLGEQYIWPSQSQFIRAYVTAGLGVKWDGVTQVDTELSADDKKVLKEAGYDWEKDPTLSYNAFLGTRKFALTNADIKSSPSYVIDMKGGQWWTLCVPFNMTKKMVDKTFGENSEVCLFDRVIRQVNNKTKKNRIVLYFTQNVYAHKTEPKGADGKWKFDENASAPNDDDIVIYAHEAYMIHPSKTDEDATFVVDNYEPVEGSPTPTVVMGKNEYVGKSDAPDNVPYRYVGNYLSKGEGRAIADVKIPKYSYVYAKSGKEKPKFWFLTDDLMTWKPNKCVVQTNERGAGEDDFQNFFDFEASSAKQASFFGTEFDDSTTAIDSMEIIAGEKNDSAIYNLEGKLVSNDGSKSNLAKGIYIQNGKKFVIK